MYDILTGIYYGELSALRGKLPLEPPYSAAESRVLCRLRAMDPETAEEWRREIRALAMDREDAAFRSGARFGAQLAAQLMREF